MDTPSSLEPPLNFAQARVLGCLLEKEMTLPEYYPLTLNALITACNQSSNREPVTSFDEATVVGALEGLRMNQRVFQISQAGARATKYKHNLPQWLPDLQRPQLALLCTLLLRGPQTLGELRQRTERMHTFEDLAAVEQTLDSLIDRADGALVRILPAGNGRRVASFFHLLCGHEPDAPAHSPRLDVPPETIIPLEPSWQQRIEQEIAHLKQQVADLKFQLGIDSP